MNSSLESKRQKGITEKYISNAIGYCYCENHPGALRRINVYKNKCIDKKYH